MTFNYHVETFAGLPVVEFEAGRVPQEQVAWRLSVEFDDGEEEFAAELGDLVAAAGPSVTTLVVGEWGSCNDTGPPLDALTARARDLPGLRSLFLGDITFEECEVSWLAQGDPTEILTAYPALTYLKNRGSTGFSTITNPVLEKLVLESGGLPASTVRAVGASDLPALTHLELWLGDENYGGDSDTDDLGEILAGSRLPALRTLGLRNAENADAVAVAVASAPVVARIEVLDLSMGTLTDAGARALLGGQPLTHLRKLDLHHHFLSDEMMVRVADALPGVEVDLGEQGKDQNSRFVAVGE